MTTRRSHLRKPSPVTSSTNIEVNAPYSENDILLKRGGIVSKRQANKLYHAFLQANVMVYKSLPKDLRTHFANNIFTFLTGPCQRKLVQYRQESDDYVTLTLDNAAPAVSAAIRDDRVAQACCSSNPLWILGLHHCPENCNSLPYVYCEEGNWVHPRSHEELQALLVKGGLQNMLILPSEFDLPECLKNDHDMQVEETTDAADSMLRELLDQDGGANPPTPTSADKSSTSAANSPPFLGNFSFQHSNCQMEEPPFSRQVSTAMGGGSGLLREVLRSSILRRSCSTISLSDIEDEDMDEQFEGFAFSQPDMTHMNESAMLYFLGESGPLEAV